MDFNHFLTSYMPNPKKIGSKVHFENREKKINNKMNKILNSAKKLLKRNKKKLSKNILNNFSSYELKNSLKLVQSLSKSMEINIKKSKGFVKNIKPKSFGQIW